MVKRKHLLAVAAAACLLAACGEETRDGQLTLSGSAPLKIADQGGQTVEFYSGPLKVEFGADSGRKFTVKLEQNGRTAKFSGQAPDVADWNFTVRGRDIGQPADFTSKRAIALYGPIARRWGLGGPCGFNGRWETDERWQKGNEDWSVLFKDAATSADIGTFASHREGQDFLIESHNVWCRERPEHEPHGRMERVSQSVSELKEKGVKFQ